MLNFPPGFRRLAVFVLLAGTLLPVAEIPAAPPEVLIVAGDGNTAHNEVITAMLAAVGDSAKRKLTLRIRTLAEPAPHVPRTDSVPALVVTVGTEAAATVHAERPGVPVFSIFLPEAAFNALAAGRNDRQRVQFTGLLLDQPFERRLRLIRLALSPTTRVGAVLGPDSRRQEAALRQAASTVGLAVQTETITEERQLIAALHRLLEDADILLAVPDAVVFNRHTAQSVLLTANGRSKPVSGFSRAYVHAGALFAVYSTAGQIGRQAGEALLRFADSGRPPPTQSPRYFSVEVNTRVARSLGIDLSDEQTLARKLTEASREGAP